MVQTQTFIWQGESGRSYEYELRTIGSTLPAVAGNYVVCGYNANGRFRAIYAGETGNLSERFDNHHKAWCIARLGATHISFHPNYAGEVARRTEEQDIIGGHSPPCNG